MDAPAEMVHRAVADYTRAVGTSGNVHLATRTLRGSDGLSVDVLATPDGTPLLLRDPRLGWIEATLGPLAARAGIAWETMMNVTWQEQGTWVDLTQDAGYVGLITANATMLFMSGELDLAWAFGQFSKADWDRVVAEWPALLSQLKAGTIPDFPYNWVGIDRLVSFAAARNLPLRAMHLIFGDDIPPSMLGYGAADLKKILEFTVRVRLLKCPSIQIWTIGDEILERSIYLRGQTGGLWPTLFGAPEIVAFVGKLVHEIYPKATLVVTESDPLEATFPDPRLAAWYLTYLQQIQDQGVEIGCADIENNFWIYDPPDPAKMDRVLGQVKALGIKTITSEMTVTTSPLFPSWPSRPKTIATVKDPLAAQATIYAETLAAYLKHETGAFGTGGVSDTFAWQASIGHPEAHPMIYDTSGRPKQADYSLRRQLLASLS